MSSPLTINSVAFRNFQSYGAATTTVKLDHVGTTLIVGIDKDSQADGEGSNGVGKTTIINAVVYALYGKPLNSGVNLDRLVNNINNKNMSVTCEFTVDGVTYAVTRSRKTKAGAAGNTCRLINVTTGQDITPDSMDACTALIVRIIGIPYDIFTRIVVFSATKTPFLELPVRHPTQVNQTDIMENLVGLTVLTEKADLLKKKISDNELQLKTLKAVAEGKESERKRFEQTLNNARNRAVNWEGETTSKIERLQSQLEQANAVDVDEELRVHEEIKVLTVERDTTLRALNTAKKAVQQHKDAIAKYQGELSHLTDAKCPYCLQDFAGAQAKIDQAGAEIERLSALCDEETRTYDVCKDRFEAKVNEIEALMEKRQVDDLNSIVKIKSRSAQIEAEIQSLSVAENPHLETLEELEQTALADIDYTDINKLVKAIEHQRFLLKLLTKSDSFIRKRLLNRCIPYLNERLSIILQQLGLSHKVEFTHEMTASISQFGRDLDFGMMSAGQRARINLALSWAFRDVYQNRYRVVNLSMLDEALDTGLDGVGVQSAVKMLKRKARDEGISMFVISHRSDDVGNAFDRQIVVQLEKGFSSMLSDTALEE